ncbi:xanthine dehydrogenase family protein molybdopterin-binding subunit [Bradyrhizobium sp.]|uniref:xanthine dehydrogenase family protein molybdopterin-binding subunit n=1 Tax=Bradyrhizobium sp. TaxID=376 RepID=UPI002D18EE03|nr:xanthine dehydrogenase family protein molybdopterin-binding subunit [Bradyrhizobium sp.]HMM89821.1 xanthine dehydrogenase family protein molybdopterin-binding subunit [Bradyrhizobium sp.]
MIDMASVRLLQDTFPSRRSFLIGATAVGSSLIVGFAAHAQSTQDPEKPAANPFAGYVEIAPDETVTVFSAHMEMGQGIYHGLASLVQEELDADWAKVTVVGRAGNTALYGNVRLGGKMQFTGGSTGTASSWERYRRAGATARAMLVAAAAAQWGVPDSEIKVEKGVVSHPSGRSATYGALASAAAVAAVPSNVALKDAKDWKYIGSETLPRYDSAPKSNGRQQYTIDLREPGMLTAVMIHPPLFGATLKSFDASKAKQMKGVADVVVTPLGIAVVASGMWEAMKARDAVIVEWDDSQAEKRSSSELAAEYRAASDDDGAVVATNIGDVDVAFAKAAKVIEARYEFPYLAHAPLEPINAAARMNPDGTLEVWGGHQMPDLYQAVAARVAGVTPDKVILRVMKTGGGFGRRATPDADIIVEAVATAKALGWTAPVKVQWTREDDMRGGRYRPAFVHKLRAALDESGNLIALRDTLVGQSIAKGTLLEQALVKGGVDALSVEGVANQPYAIPNVRIDLTTTDVKVPVLWWRAVGSTHTAYALETFIDEVAHSGGKDPVEFRLAMLKDKPRHVAVLKLAAEKAGWDKALPAGRYRGIAVAESFRSYVAQVAEISVGKGGIPRVHRVVCAVDCGVAVNPDQVRAQMEGGIGFGLGAILKSELTLDKGRVVQGNFDGYDVLRLNEMPSVEVHLVKSSAPPTGVGEPGVPPVGPAVANAYFQATGKRVRVLPFSSSGNA